MNVDENDIYAAKALDARARRAAKRVGLHVVKARGAETIDNRGGYMLVNQDNWIVAGERFDLSAEFIIEYCQE
jgi:hypothetical protein